MLTKLLKYEYKATARVFLGLYLALFITAAIMGISVSFSDMGKAVSFLTGMNVNANGTTFGNSMITIGTLVYSCLVIAMFVLLYVTICQRFYKNLLGSEGYLMHTLPVSPASLVLSKLLVALFWVAASVLMLFFTLVILALAATQGQIVQYIDLNDYFFIQPDAFLLSMIPVLLCQFVVSILSIYLAMMIGHQTTKGTLALSIIAFFVIGSVKSTLVLWVSDLLFTDFLQNMAMQGSFSQFYWASNLISMGYEVVFGALYFVAIVFLLRKRLNLV